MNLLRVVCARPDGPRETFLRDPYEDGKWLKGIECNAYGVANRDGCMDAEIWILRRRVMHTAPVDRLVRV